MIAGNPSATRAPDLDAICTLISEPAWGNIGRHVRIAWASLTGESRGSASTEKFVAEMLGDDGTLFEETLHGIGQTRIALLDIATMLKSSLAAQWKAVDTYLVARGLPAASAGVDDELCSDDQLLALRPAFEAGRANMKAASDRVAAAAKQPKAKAKLKAAYASQTKAVDVDRGIVSRVSAMRARSKKGIQFKREVREYWADCECPELDRSIFADLIAYVEASP